MNDTRFIPGKEGFAWLCLVLAVSISTTEREAVSHVPEGTELSPLKERGFCTAGSDRPVVDSIMSEQGASDKNI